MVEKVLKFKTRVMWKKQSNEQTVGHLRLTLGNGCGSLDDTFLSKTWEGVSEVGSKTQPLTERSRRACGRQGIGRSLCADIKILEN